MSGTHMPDPCLVLSSPQRLKSSKVTKELFLKELKAQFLFSAWHCCDWFTCTYKSEQPIITMPCTEQKPALKQFSKEVISR